MKFKIWRRGGEPVLPRSISRLWGVGLGAVLIGNLMVPSFAARDLAATDGVTGSEVVLLAGVANLAVALAGLFLAVTGRQPRWPWVVGALTLAAVALVVPLMIRITHPNFLTVAAVALGVFGFGAGFAQLSGQTAAVAGVAESRRSEAVGEMMSWHLVAAGVLGGIAAIPFFSWFGGEVALVIAFVALAGAVAVQRRELDLARPQPRDPDPGEGKQGGLFRLVGPGTVAVAAGQAGWTLLYLLPGIHEMKPRMIALTVVVAQIVAWFVLRHLGEMVDGKRLRAAILSGSVLLLSIVGLVVLPAALKGVLADWTGLACLVVGEAAANIFITAIEGEISVEDGGRRAQLAGHSAKFAAVGAAAVVVSYVTGMLVASQGSVEGVIVAGVGTASLLATVCGVGLCLLRARQVRSGTPAQPQPAALVTEGSVAGAPALWVGEDPAGGLTKLVVVFVGGKESYRPLLARLAPMGVNAVAIDVPGFGAPAGPGPLFPQGVKCLGEVLDELSTSWRPRFLGRTKRPRFVLFGRRAAGALIGAYHSGRADRRVVANYLLAPLGLGDPSPTVEGGLDDALAAEWSREFARPRIRTGSTIEPLELIQKWLSEMPAHCDWTQLEGKTVVGVCADDEVVPLGVFGAVPAKAWWEPIQSSPVPQTDEEWERVVDSLQGLLQYVDRP